MLSSVFDIFSKQIIAQDTTFVKNIVFSLHKDLITYAVYHCHVNQINSFERYNFSVTPNGFANKDICSQRLHGQ